MRICLHFALALITVTGLMVKAHAAERVTLSNGFALSCNHHELASGRVRLYTTPDSDSYIELSPEEITNIEPTPDPPLKPAVEGQPATLADGRLNPGDLHQILSDAGREHHIDVDLLASVVKAESGGDARALSRAGARGLMQLMPGTAANLGVQDSYRPDQNVRGGSAYLDALLSRYHDNLALALAAYNAGPAAVERYRGIPPYRETRLYVARVIHEFNRRVVAREKAVSAASASSAQASR